MVISTCVEWVNVPEVAVSTTEKEEELAFVAAVNRTCCPIPGVSVKLAGDTDTPCGSPVIDRVTADEKLLIGVAVMVAVSACPATMVKVEGEIAMAKSGVAGEIGLVELTEEPPPQATNEMATPRIRTHRVERNRRIKEGMIRIYFPPVPFWESPDVTSQSFPSIGTNPHLVNTFLVSVGTALPLACLLRSHLPPIEMNLACGQLCYRSFPNSAV
jgi:hypothetical protein